MDQTSEITSEAIESLVRPRLKFLQTGRELSPDENLGDLGLDSMTAIDLLLDLETHFGIVIDDESLTENSFSSVAEIKALVESSRAIM